MGTTLTNGIYLPSEGEKNCYQGLASNWNKVDGALGDVAELKRLIENKFTKEIVTELPTEDINPYCIYMILKTAPETNNIYDEWVYINNAWEYLGNTQVDMTQYYTKQEVNELPAVASGVTSTKVGNYDAHIANGDIHVTANDKTKWTNSANTVVLRLAKTALAPSSSTNAFSNLDDSTALKVGDKVMDTAGVLFEVTAIDTANSTFTIGTSLIDLAQDSDVVHKSGNETISGTKTFTDNLNFKSNSAEYGVTSGNIQFYLMDKNSNGLSKINQGVFNNGISYITLQIYGRDGNNQSVSNTITFQYGSDFNRSYLLPSNNNVLLGSSGNKWAEVYATKYYYGSNNVEFSSKFVTSDTAQTVSGSKTFSSNVNVYNSDSSTDTANIILKNSKAERGSTTNTGEQNISFVDKNNNQLGNIKCITNSSGVSNMYISCNASGNDKGVRLSVTPSSTYFRSIADNDCKLGTTDVRWSDVQTYKINALEPSSLSLPSETYVDISSYFTNTGTGDTNSYTASANGWIYLRLGDISGCQATILDTNNNRMWGQSSTGSVEQITIPILKGQTLTTQWNTSSTVFVATARFYPCQGNI